MRYNQRCFITRAEIVYYGDFWRAFRTSINSGSFSKLHLNKLWQLLKTASCAQNNVHLSLCFNRSIYLPVQENILVTTQGFCQYIALAPSAATGNMHADTWEIGASIATSGVHRLADAGV